MLTNTKRFLPERAYRKLIREAYYSNQDSEQIFQNIVDRGLVLEVDYYGNDENGISPYSIKVKTEKRYDTLNKDLFFPPLFPVHRLALPQVGEEVWILLTTTNNKTKGFWISRVNYDDDFSNNSLIQYDTSNLDESQIYGFGLLKNDLKETHDIEPKNDYKVPKIRIKPGDVFDHGRSNTHLIHSFDSKNKKGIIDIITEIEKSKKEFYEQEFSISNGSRILLVTERNLDDVIIKNDLEKNFHINFSEISGEVQDESFTLIESDQIRLISRKGNDVNHLVLGEKHSDWINELLNVVKDFVGENQNFATEVQNGLDNLIDSYNSHIHLTPVGPSSPLSTPFITEKVGIDNNLQDVRDNLENIKTRMDEHYNKINEIYSKHAACN